MPRKTKKPAAKRPASRSKGRPARKAARPAAKAKAKKAAPKKAASKKAAAKRKPAAPAKLSAADLERRRLDAEERALEREEETVPERNALADSPEFIPEAMNDSLAEELGEGAVGSAVSGDQEDENIRDEDVEEEEGGPFVETTARQELARGTDESNPEDAEPAAVPTANARRN
jgi:hypothetical protein